MGSLALSLCHLAAVASTASVSLKAARSVDIAAAQLLVREAGSRSSSSRIRRSRRAPLDLVPRVAARAPRRPVIAATARSARHERSPPSRRQLRSPDEPDRDAILKALENVIDPSSAARHRARHGPRRPRRGRRLGRVTIALTVAGCPLRDSFQEQVPRSSARSRA
jgi:hypothetical protein